ncbi:unnamed protein product [Nyctereutes procyonoides]|uniref:(raccoon dog) hypothetical protein n=1 Tax=Nyctereutes procyonoides TaxID=34880 RepID=A0A811ZF15_NYCPR|nr:unnamed protein product [Nyctereutes procyonoides]
MGQPGWLSSLAPAFGPGKDEEEQVANKGDSLALPLKACEYCVTRWGMIQRLGEPQTRLREEDRKRIGEEVRPQMEKLREKQFGHSQEAVSTDPPHHDHHFMFALCLESQYFP